MTTSLYDIPLQRLNGEAATLAEHQGQVLLIVNTASACGLTPQYAGLEVNGEHTHPLYGWLKKAAPGLLGSEAIKWNFTKFLVGRDGLVLDRYAPTTTPESLAADIEKALAG